MEARDLIVTPLLIILLYVIAYIVRPHVTDEITRAYFFPALTVRIIGALAIGFIYQFYYQGGDTYNYHTHGSRQIWEAFIDSPDKALKLFVGDPGNTIGIYKYSSNIIFFGDPSSYIIVRLAFIFDLLTFSSYSATSILFSIVSFVGSWLFFLTFYGQYPYLHKRLAIASFFIPSVFFWGSGLLKDTVTLACLGIATYYTYRIFINRQTSTWSVLFLVIAIYGLYTIKIYILLTFLPAAILWIFAVHFVNIRPLVLRIILFPFLFVIAIGAAYYATSKAAEDNSKYALGNIVQTAKTTAYDIRYWTGREAGSGYSLGDLDGSIGSMVRMAPQAINVSLFRPYLWEVKNPLMLLSAIESLILFTVFLYLLIRRNRLIFISAKNANILYVIIFSLTFAFAVGVSTFNFGTLVRYKIPMLPFFTVALILIEDYSKRLRKVEALDVIE